MPESKAPLSFADRDDPVTHTIENSILFDITKTAENALNPKITYNPNDPHEMQMEAYRIRGEALQHIIDVFSEHVILF